MSSVVVVDDVSPVVRTRDVDRIRYCSFGIVGVPKAKYTVFSVGCIRYVNRKSQKSRGVTVTFS